MADVSEEMRRVGSGMVLTSDVRLLNALLREPLCQDVRHGLRRERHRERVLLVVPRHRGDVLHRDQRARCGVSVSTHEIFGDVHFHRLVRQTEHRDDFAHAI